MKKLGVLFFTALFLIGCGSTDEAVDDSNLFIIESRDVQGTIKANPDNTTNHSNRSGDFETKGMSLEFEDKGDIIIHLTKDDLETTENKMVKSTVYDKVEIIDKGSNYISYYTERGGDIKGYGFKIIYPYNDAFLFIEGRGNDFYEPIATKEINQELLNIALTFKAK